MAESDAYAWFLSFRGRLERHVLVRATDKSVFVRENGGVRQRPKVSSVGRWFLDPEEAHEARLKQLTNEALHLEDRLREVRALLAKSREFAVVDGDPIELPGQRLILD